MKNLTTFCVTFVLGITISHCQCSVNYAFVGTSDTLTFSNLSLVSNAHYYWSFGDGTGSTDENPVHIFPDDGEYLVTLYGLDTISNCVDTYETWIPINKPDTNLCNLLLSDTIQSCGPNECLVTTNLSTNCSGLNIDCDAGPGENGAWNVWLGGGWVNALFIDRLQAYTYDSIFGLRIHEEYYKTVQYHYSSNINYGNCSANFEVEINPQSTGAQVTFKAMNKNATSYEWEIIGFGNPIYQTSKIISHFYPYDFYLKNARWLVVLRINDTINNCGDTITQQILISNPNYIFPTGQNELTISDLVIYPNPSTNELTIEQNYIESYYRYEIYNLIGESLNFYDSFEKKTTIDVSNLDSGTYILKVVTSKGIFYRKFLKL